MRRFLRDAAVALAVGAVLVALAMVLKPPPEDPLSSTPETARESPPP